jgi:hypothetical protein
LRLKRVSTRIAQVLHFPFSTINIMSVDERPIINYLIRMVVPMKREFQRQLDVSQFLHDPDYARRILGEAMTSQDPRLKEFATYIAERLPHAQGAATRPPTRAVPPAPQTPTQGVDVRPATHGDSRAQPSPATQPQKPPTSAQAPSSEEELLLARVERYRTGLR